MTDSGLGTMTRCAEVIPGECISISIAHFQVVLYLVFKSRPRAHLSYENEFYLHVNETRFHKNSLMHKDSLWRRGTRQHENGLS